MEQITGVGERLEGVRFFIAASILASMAMATVAAPEASAKDTLEPPQPTRGWKLERAWDFNGSELPESWSVRELAPSKTNDQYTSEDNVKVGDGVLRLKLTRGCRDWEKQPVSKITPTTDVCPTGTETVVIGSRVETPPILHDNYRLEFRVDFSEMELPGARVAGWSKNLEGDCDENTTLYAEQDVVEWYPAKPTVSTATTHRVCDDGEINNSFHTASFGDDWMNTPHTFAEEVVDQTTTYFIDDEAVKIAGKENWTDDKSDFKEVNNGDYYKASIMPQFIILDVEGFMDPKAKDEAFMPADPTKPYPVQYADFEWVKVYYKQ